MIVKTLSEFIERLLNKEEVDVVTSHVFLSEDFPRKSWLNLGKSIHFDEDHNSYRGYIYQADKIVYPDEFVQSILMKEKNVLFCALDCIVQGDQSLLLSRLDQLIRLFGKEWLTPDKAWRTCFSSWGEGKDDIAKWLGKNIGLPSDNDFNVFRKDSRWWYVMNAEQARHYYDLACNEITEKIKQNLS